MAARELKVTARNGFHIPANSTAIGLCDAVMLDTSNRLTPLTLTATGQARFVGFAADQWSQQIAIDLYGVVAAYSTPNSFNSGAVHRVHVIMDGSVVEIAISDTSGNAGDTVYASTVTSGAMIFTVTKPAGGAACVEVGHLKKSFTGATANDTQEVVVRPAFVNTLETDIQWYLNNHVIDGLTCAWDSTSHVSYAAGDVFVNGKYYHVAAATAALAWGCATHATKCRTVLFYVGTTGAAAVKTGTVYFTMTTAGATVAAAARNSNYWPTFSLEGVIFGVGIFRSGSADLAASRVYSVRRSLQDIGWRKYITGNPTTGGPTLR